MKQSYKPSKPSKRTKSIRRIHLIDGDYFETYFYDKVSVYISFTELNGIDMEIPWTSILYIERREDQSEKCS